MELSPKLYHWFVRPRWISDRYLYNVLQKDYDFNGKKILDFGSGIGSSSQMFNSGCYLGVDCDSQRVNYARRMYPGRSFEVLKGRRLPVQDNSVDYILIFSVLHHIPSWELPGYLQEFRRVLNRQKGKVLVIEPCFFDGSRLCNIFMERFDKGRFIRREEDYICLFTDNSYHVNINDRYRQMLFYNKLFFSAAPI